jgi:hypothetical protein
MSTNPKTPAWLIERLALGELSAAAAEDVRARLRAEGRDVDAVLAEVAASNRALLDELPKRQVAASIRARLEARRPVRRSRFFMLALPALGAAVALAVVVMVRQPGTESDLPVPGGSRPEILIPKGDPGLLVLRKREARLERLSEGARATEGDLLQLDYFHCVGYGVVLSLDGAGRITLHLPQGGADMAAPLASGRVRLPSSYELDDAPHFERFFIVTSPTPFKVTTVVDAVRSLARTSAAASGRLPLPLPFAQNSIRIDKIQKELP